ncbi:MAG: hypothetical protein LBQ96_08640, partial [Fusobacteriaceae bacterium]|nr:hypothetical protein [Fusobacteriaceae bacterium]
EKKYLICEETYGFVGGKNFRTEDIPETPWIRHEISGTRIQSRKFLNEWWKDRFGEAFHSETISVNSIEAVVNLVARGFGWAVLPEVHTKNREDLRFFPITKKDGSGFRRNTWLLCKNKSVKKEVVRMFMECILRKG